MVKRLSNILIWTLAILSLLLLIGFVATQRFRHPSSFEVNVDRNAVITQIRSLGRLETASFTIEQIIDAQTNETNAFTKLLFGDQILLIAHGEVIAGVDFASFSPNDIKIDGKSIKLTLPAPSIFIVALDNEKTKVYDRRQGILRRNDTQLEAEARKGAEAAIRKAACEGDILEKAKEHAQAQITSLLKGLGFEEVTLEIPVGIC